MLYRFLKFCSVGLLGVIVNMAVFMLLTKAGVNYVLSAVFSFAAAASNNFVFNYKWTFQDKETSDKGRFERYLQFVIISGACLAVNLTVLGLLVEQFSFVEWQAQIIAIFSVSVLNFVLQNAITFASATGNR